MLEPEKMQRLREMVTEVTTREGCRLYDIEFVGGSRGQGRVVRVFIDKLPDGASIEDCSNVSRGLNLLLDVEDLVPGTAYTLEVSTPGLDRLLREGWHFESVVGKKIWVKTSSSMEQERVRKQATGVLVAATPETIRLAVDQMELEIPLSIIERSRVVVEWNEPKGKKKNK